MTATDAKCERCGESIKPGQWMCGLTAEGVSKVWHAECPNGGTVTDNPSIDRVEEIERLWAEVERLQTERDGWKQAAVLFRAIAADGVLRLKGGYSYAQAQDRYDKALAASPTEGRKPGHSIVCPCCTTEPFGPDAGNP